MTAEVSSMAKEQRPQEESPQPQWSPAAGVVGTFMGRDALALLVSGLDLKPADRILLPAYLCGEVVKPFVGRSHVDFYAVPPNLIVDPDQLGAKLADHKEPAKALLIINYFGFLQPYRKEIKTLCASKGILLIEDCAHSLLTEGSGGTGDFSIHSFRKTLPVPDGGGLQVNCGRKVVTPDFYPRVYANALSLCITLKLMLKLRSETLSRAGFASRQHNRLSHDGVRKGPRRFLPLSSFCSAGIRKAPCTEIIARRRRDFLFWQQVAEGGGSFTPVFTELPPGVCPLGYPVKVQDRDAIKARLQEQGIFLRTHWRLPAAIGPEFVNSHELSAQMLTLPVHPELGDRDREVILQVLSRGTSRGG